MHWSEVLGNDVTALDIAAAAAYDGIDDLAQYLEDGYLGLCDENPEFDPDRKYSHADFERWARQINNELESGGH